jgi:rare lipoprotein A
VSGWRTAASVLLPCLLLAGCAGPGQKQVDSAPPPRADLYRVPDAVPRPEPRSRGGNHSPYTVFGRTYTVMPDARGYRAEGIASWYGMKFHGRQTSNGEIYDVYAMTAAHRSLPLPTFVRVTNLENGRRVIVRVNDRGPFHGDRLIDLSYAAAYRLGFHEKGTARVLVEAIEPSAGAQPHTPPQTVAAAPASPAPGSLAPDYPAGDATALADAGAVLQVGAFRTLESAERLRAKLTMLVDQSVFIDASDPTGQAWYRVRIGPIADPDAVGTVRRIISEYRLGVPHVVGAP